MRLVSAAWSLVWLAATLPSGEATTPRFRPTPALPRFKGRRLRQQLHAQQHALEAASRRGVGDSVDDLEEVDTAQFSTGHTRSDDESDGSRLTRQPGRDRDLSVMTWNILADALSNDGFVLAQTDAEDSLDKAKTSAFIGKQVGFRDEAISACRAAMTRRCWAPGHKTCADNHGEYRNRRKIR